MDSEQSPELYTANDMSEIAQLQEENSAPRVEDICNAEDEEDCDTDSEVDYAEYKARKGPVYWDWCVYKKTWYWWPVDDPELAKARTTHWNFTNREGETAFGNDPLEYFDDWNSEKGDVAEPTPFGPEFTKAWVYSRDQTDQQPPEGAERWDDQNLPEYDSFDSEAVLNWDGPPKGFGAYDFPWSCLNGNDEARQVEDRDDDSDAHFQITSNEL